MKKGFLGLAALMIAGIGFTSCKKDYTCTCTWDDGINANNTFAWEFPDQKKKDAEEACDSQETTLKNIDSGASCELGS